MKERSIIGIIRMNTGSIVMLRKRGIQGTRSSLSKKERKKKSRKKKTHDYVESGTLECSLLGEILK